MAEQYSFALEDDLLKEYLAYRHPDLFEGFITNKNDLERLLSFRVKPFIYTTKQLKTVGYDPSGNLNKTLRAANLTTQPLVDLLKKTAYKGILSKSKNDYPYINIHNSNIHPAIIGAFAPSEPRQVAIEHLKRLLENAQEIVVQDKYLLCGRNSIDSLKAILPQKPGVKLVFPIKLEDAADYTWQQAEADLKSFCSQWNIIRNNLSTNYHDRYLVIDRKVQVVLTSGLDYVKNIQKELTYVIVPYISSLI